MPVCEKVEAEKVEIDRIDGAIEVGVAVERVSHEHGRRIHAQPRKRRRKRRVNLRRFRIAKSGEMIQISRRRAVDAGGVPRAVGISRCDLLHNGGKGRCGGWIRRRNTPSTDTVPVLVRARNFIALPAPIRIVPVFVLAKLAVPPLITAMLPALFDTGIWKGMPGVLSNLAPGPSIRIVPAFAVGLQSGEVPGTRMREFACIAHVPTSVDSVLLLMSMEARGAFDYARVAA